MLGDSMRAKMNDKILLYLKENTIKRAVFSSHPIDFQRVIENLQSTFV